VACGEELSGIAKLRDGNPILQESWEGLSCLSLYQAVKACGQ
jgi:hypothetical protein